MGVLVSRNKRSRRIRLTLQLRPELRRARAHDIRCVSRPPLDVGLAATSRSPRTNEKNLRSSEEQLPSSYGSETPNAAAVTAPTASAKHQHPSSRRILEVCCPDQHTPAALANLQEVSRASQDWISTL